jgi:hypothetical protein
MKEGDVSHDDVNVAIAAADKTIIFGRQNRTSDGVLLPDKKLPRFHAGHDTVKFFYSAVRQLPEYFLDAILRCNISVTLVLGKGLLVFRDVRHHQAIHSGRTRRTIYLPAKVLDVAASNGYDYWSITQLLIIEGWKILDYILLLRLVIASRQYMADHSASVLGWSTVRRFLQKHNRHRSTFESEELAAKRDKWGLDIPISELEAFIDLYEKKLLRAVQYGGDGGLGSDLPMPFHKMDPEDITKALYNEHVEGVWAARKAEEICQEMGYPDFFLLDRDIIHPAARDLAEAAGQDTTPQTIDEARHDYDDRMRFGIGPELATEWFVDQGLRFAPQGLRGLVEHMAAGIFRDGQLNRMLWDKTLEGLLRFVARSDRVTIEMGEGNQGVAKAEDVVRNHLDRGLDLMRLRELVLFHDQVQQGQQKLELEHVELLREQMVELVESKGRAGDMRRQMLLLLSDVRKLFGELKGLLVGEGKRLLGGQVKLEHIEPPDELLMWIDDAMERAMLQLTLNLELMPDFHHTVERLAAEGSPVSQDELQRFLRWSADDPGRQMAVSAARRGLAARDGETAVPAGDSALGDIYNRVEGIAARLPERPHTATSDKITPLRRALKELESVRQATPTHPKQLGVLAMVLVRLDRHPEYASFLQEVHWMGEHAVGVLVSAGLASFYTPGLLRVIDEIGAKHEPIGVNALELALELTGEPNLELMIQHRTTSP